MMNLVKELIYDELFNTQLIIENVFNTGMNVFVTRQSDNTFKLSVNRQYIDNESDENFELLTYNLKHYPGDLNNASALKVISLLSNLKNYTNYAIPMEIYKQHVTYSETVDLGNFKDVLVKDNNFVTNKLIDFITTKCNLNVLKRLYYGDVCFPNVSLKCQEDFINNGDVDYLINYLINDYDCFNPKHSSDLLILRHYAKLIKSQHSNLILKFKNRNDRGFDYVINLDSGVEVNLSVEYDDEEFNKYLIHTKEFMFTIENDVITSVLCDLCDDTVLDYDFRLQKLVPTKHFNLIKQTVFGSIDFEFFVNELEVYFKLISKHNIVSYNPHSNLINTYEELYKQMKLSNYK